MVSRSKNSIPSAPPLEEPTPRFPRQKQPPPGLEHKLDPEPRWRGERYRPAAKLEGQIAIVIGGDSGIGRAVAYFFAREGADVTITALPEERQDAHETRDAIEGLGRRCLILEGDLRQRDFCDQVIARTIEKYEKLDILVHNAAWQNRKAVTELSEDELDSTLKTNIYAYLRLARAAVPHMKEGACIIATGSIVGLQGSEKLSDYGATKGAIHSITKCLAHELAEKRIRVNCVAPGPVWTPLNPSDTGMSREDVATFGQRGESPLQSRPAQPEELAPAYVFLASEADSSYITGAVLPVTGEPV